MRSLAVARIAAIALHFCGAVLRLLRRLLSDLLSRLVRGLGDRQTTRGGRAIDLRRGALEGSLSRVS